VKGLRLLEGSKPEGGPVALPMIEAKAKSARRRPLLCAACGQGITWEDRRREVSGGHAHTRVNPLGIAFHFGCFSEAEGCTVHGEPTDEHSWFRGCAWQLAHCGRCGVHLGWLFSGADSFFGLVLDRLTPGDARPEA
jgi:hypothetical protein